MNLVDHMQFQLDSSFDQCIGLIREHYISLTMRGFYMSM